MFIQGPRKSGKTTLVRILGDTADDECITIDIDVQLAAAQVDPVGFVAGLAERNVLDEAQCSRM